MIDIEIDVLYIPGVVWSIICKEYVCHISIAFVEEGEVVCLHVVQQHQDKPCMINHTDPEGSSFPQMASTYLAFISLVLVQNDAGRHD